MADFCFKIPNEPTEEAHYGGLLLGIASYAQGEAAKWRTFVSKSQMSPPRRRTMADFCFKIPNRPTEEAHYGGLFLCIASYAQDEAAKWRTFVSKSQIGPPRRRTMADFCFKIPNRPTEEATKKGPMKENPSRVRSFEMIRSALGNSAGRAYTCAGAALDALVCIDIVLGIACGNSLYRALRCACTAADTRIADYVSHDVTS